MNGRRTPWLLLILALVLVCGCLAALVTGAGFYALRVRQGLTPAAARLTALPDVTATRLAARQETPVGPTPAVAADETPGRPTPTAAPTRDLALGPRSSGGELRLPGGMPPTLDPAQSTDATSASYITEIFSGLVTLDPNLELVPDITESYEVSSDGRTYTFHLRSNVHFHDGRAVTAEDVKFSLERSTDPVSGSPVAATYLGDIVGAREKLSGGATELAGVRIVDDYTLEIEIDAPRPSFLSKLTHPVAFVVDRKGIDSGDVLAATNGTGPFRLEELIPYDRIVLVANTDYYREPKPVLDRVVFIMSGGYPVTMYENDELDTAPVGSADLPRITDPATGVDRELTINEQLSTFYVGMNCALPPFDDVKVRQAFAQALDRQRIVDLLYDRTEPAAKTIVPPLMPDYDNEGLSAPPYDPEAARRLLAESSYGGAAGLPPVTLHVSSGGPDTDPVADAIAYVLEQNLGVTIGIEQSEWSDFLTELNRPEQPYQMFVLGWIADYPDPENFLYLLFGSGSADNHSRYANEEVNRLLDQAGLEMDPARRNDLYVEAERIILAEAPIVPLYHDVEYWLTKPYVQDLYYPAMIVPRFQYAHIER